MPHRLKTGNENACQELCIHGPVMKQNLDLLYNPSKLLQKKTKRISSEEILCTLSTCL